MLRMKPKGRFVTCLTKKASVLVACTTAALACADDAGSVRINPVHLTCSGRVTLNGQSVNGELGVRACIDAERRRLMLWQGNELILDDAPKEEPNRFFYSHIDSEKVHLFFEVDRSSLDFSFMRTMYDKEGASVFVVIKGTCALGLSKRKF